MVVVTWGFSVLDGGDERRRSLAGRILANSATCEFKFWSKNEGDPLRVNISGAPCSISGCLEPLFSGCVLEFQRKPLDATRRTLVRLAAPNLMKLRASGYRVRGC